MTSALDMSLDDLIKSNKKSTGQNSRVRGGGRGGDSILGPARPFFKRATNRTAPYSKPAQAPESTWQHDLFGNNAPSYPTPAGRSSSIETGTKLYISNLEYGVSNEDIKDLFSEVGDIKRYTIHFDRSGRSKGTAEIVFTRQTDALAAVKRYNNVQLDGKPMKIEIVGTNISTPGSAPPPANALFGNQSGAYRSRQQRGSAMGRLSRGGSGGRGIRGGRGRSRGRGEKTPVSLEALDADLEKYHETAKQSDGMIE
ncbi:hypothetical protein LWI28_023616 [Acer negundo]|uniref:RRM domain-containing protein n=1 Tax=Acer negundo TaxID=4023 RepID=A0AAD5I7T2_ACENE|nr:hypothetical protein LWI28_023616 [Acer negundo]KAK4833699.1 hypothetical protein QYF36_009597 [Acer negundo]